MSPFSVELQVEGLQINQKADSIKYISLRILQQSKISELFLLNICDVLLLH